MHPDVTIVGGGVIGLSLARELAGKGRRVMLLERGSPGREASWAGAGILPPGNLNGTAEPLDSLRALSATLWNDLADSLREETGVDTGFRICGGLTLTCGTESSADDLAAWQSEGVPLEVLDADGLHRCEPALAPEIVAGFRLPQLAQVRNPRYLRALEASCRKRGVEILSGRHICAAEFSDGGMIALRTESERFAANQFCFCTGAWTGTLTDSLRIQIPIVPIRGQIVLLNCGSPLFHHVLEVGKRYLVPRPDGRVLVGATEERAGFEKRNTASAVSALIQFAQTLVPALADADVERTWSGLRPGCERGYPYLARHREYENVFIAAGHFRSGLQTSPGTALLMRQLICGETPTIDLTPFADFAGG